MSTVFKRGSPDEEAAVILGAEVGGAACNGCCCVLDA